MRLFLCFPAAVLLVGCSIDDEGPPGPPSDPLQPIPTTCSTNPEADACHRDAGRRDGGRIAPEGENVDTTDQTA